MRAKFSVIVPCYNEKDNLPALFESFKASIPVNAPESVQVVFVDNGSSDGSLDVMKKLEADWLTICHVPENQGYGYGIKEGLRMAEGEFIGWTHADLQTDPADLWRGLEALRGEESPDKCYLKGVRMNRPWTDEFFTFGMGLVSSVALGGSYFDVNAQPKIFPRRYQDDVLTGPDDFSLDLFLLWLMNKAELKQVTIPVNFGERVAGEVKGGGSMKGKLKLIRRTFTYIFELRSSLKDYS